MAYLPPEADERIREILKSGRSVLIDSSKKGIKIIPLDKRDCKEFYIMAYPSGGK